MTKLLIGIAGLLGLLALVLFERITGKRTQIGVAGMLMIGTVLLWLVLVVLNATGLNPAEAPRRGEVFTPSEIEQLERDASGQ
jgi:hypothetical protein